MKPKYIKQKALILVHMRIGSVESMVAKYKEATSAPDPSAALKQECADAELLDFTNNDISASVFGKICGAFSFPNVTELYMVRCS